MRELYRLVERAARSEAPVLVRGERGTGKEVLSQALHSLSSRGNGPFVQTLWAQLSESYVESQLFGNSDRAVHQATRSGQGKVALAEGGTLLLEEISEFSPATQYKLMRLLQGGEYESCGDSGMSSANVRVIATSSQNLERLMEEGKFSRDLFETLSVFTIEIPPLRDRKADILELAQRFVRKHARTNGKPVQHIASAAASRLLTYAWPGNLLELERAMERAVLTCNEGVIDVPHLPPSLRRECSDGRDSNEGLQETLDAIEKAMIVEALTYSNGNQSRAAQLLGMTERLMGLRVKKYGLDPRDIRTES